MKAGKPMCCGTCMAVTVDYTCGKVQALKLELFAETPQYSTITERDCATWIQHTRENTRCPPLSNPPTQPCTCEKPNPIAHPRGGQPVCHPLRFPRRELHVQEGAMMRTHSHACTRTHSHACARTHTHAHARTRTHAHAFARMRTHAHACTSTHTHTHTHTHARTHTHPHTHT
jgi:hypothetical protein